MCVGVVHDSHLELYARSSFTTMDQADSEFCLKTAKKKSDWSVMVCPLLHLAPSTPHPPLSAMFSLSVQWMFVGFCCSFFDVPSLYLSLQCLHCHVSLHCRVLSCLKVILSFCHLALYVENSPTARVLGTDSRKSISPRLILKHWHASGFREARYK